MARKNKKQDKPLRWRLNCIGAWREFRGFTQDGTIDALEADPLLDRKDMVTRNSLSRIENGKQMPRVATIEALARLYRTDIDSMLNRMPTKDDEPPPTGIGMLQIWDNANPDSRDRIFDLAKRIVKTET